MERKGGPELREGHGAGDISRPHEDLAKLFIATVQGDISAKSCVVQDGQLLSSDEPIGRRAPPNLAMVAQLLRAPALLADSIEHWLVSLFNQRKAESNEIASWEASTCRIREIRRRKRGRPRNPRYADWVSSLPEAALKAVEALRSESADLRDDNLTVLSIVLADMRPLPPAVRTWLADVFDPCSSFDFQVNARTFVRRHSGAKPDPDWFGWAAGSKVEELLQNGVQGKQAIWEIAQEYNKSEAHVESALQFWRIAKKVDAEKKIARRKPSLSENRDDF